MPDLNDAIATDILRARAFSYRRMSLALAVLLIALCTLPVDFSNLNAFGLKASPGTNQRALVLWSLCALLAYHLTCFAFFAWQDVQIWRHNVTKSLGTTAMRYRPYFPELRMYFGLGPTGTSNQQTPHGLVTDWAQFVEDHMVRWRSRALNPQPQLTNIGYEVSITLRRIARNTMFWFVIYDCLPIYLTLAALAVAAIHH